MFDRGKFILDIPPRVETKEQLDRILAHMHDHNASDIFIYSNNKIWMRVNGRMVPISKRKLKINEVRSLVQILDGTSAVGRLGDAEPIDTAYEMKDQVNIPGEEDLVLRRRRFRVNGITNITQGSSGISITIRKLSTEIVRAKDLGVEQELIDVVTSSRQGLILVAGGTGHGKSTLLSSLISESLLDEEGNHVLVTVESPVEYVYEELDMPSSIVCQMEIGSCVKSFSRGVENTLRMAPTMIVVGEVRDKATSGVSIEASNTGHLVFATLHSNTVSSTPERFIGLFDSDAEKQKARFDLINEAKCFIAQRLINTLDGKRVAIREYLIFNSEVREYLYDNMNNLTRAIKHAIKKWGRPMCVDIQRKLDAGLISEKDAQDLFKEYE